MQVLSRSEVVDQFFGEIEAFTIKGKGKIDDFIPIDLFSGADDLLYVLIYKKRFDSFFLIISRFQLDTGFGDRKFLHLEEGTSFEANCQSYMQTTDTIQSAWRLWKRRGRPPTNLEWDTPWAWYEYSIGKVRPKAS